MRVPGIFIFKGMIMKRILSLYLTVLLLMMCMPFSIAAEQSGGGRNPEKSFMKLLSYRSLLPSDYQYTDYKAIAELFDLLVFNFHDAGDFLPFIWEDKTYGGFGIPAYVGDGRMHTDGAQEAVTVMAAVLYASLNGIDKSRQNGDDYVRGLNAFFSYKEGIVLNNPNGSSKTTSMWYLLYPAILYAQVSLLYEDQEEMRANMLATIESWYGAYAVMNDLAQGFDYTGFDFTMMEPYQNGIWSEPDSAVGMAVLFKFGYELTGERKYLEAIIHLMDYIETFFGGPLYELLMYYAPALTACLNTLYGTEYDLQRALNRVFSGSSIPRGGWGSLAGAWGDIETGGLFGSTTDGGGYAFSMNTFAAAGAIAPTVRYDTRYAKGIGQFLLHLHGNARYFYASGTKPENQSASYLNMTIPDAILRAVPYEGIRKQSNGKSPWIGGDPTVYGWAQTDFSLYSGAHAGILGALFEKTNQEAILKMDLLITDTTAEAGYPTYLIYNPHEDTREIAYTVKTPAVDLYNAVTNSIITANITTETFVCLQPDEAMVIVEIPTGAPIQKRGRNYYANDVYISSDRVSLFIEGAENNGSVEQEVTLTVNLASNFIDRIKKTTLTCGDKEISFTDTVTVSTETFGTGAKQLQFYMETESGLTDTLTLRLTFK